MVTDVPASELDLEAFLARGAPPDIPREAIDRVAGLGTALSRFDPIKSALVIAALCTEERYQPNIIRLDWLLRLFLSAGAGNRKAKRADLNQLLNGALVAAGAGRLEDPPEERFVDHIPTVRGNFQIFTGYFEKAASLTEAVLVAFEKLADNPQKTSALKRAYALLRLSEALVERAAAARTSIAGSGPQSPLLLPSDERIQKITKRVHFRGAEIEALGVDIADLEGFCLPENLRPGLASFDVGNAPLDWYPLYRADDGVYVLAPHTMSVAVRACLIDCAVSGGVSANLQHRMLLKQGTDVSDTAFLDLDRVPVMPLAGGPAKDLSYEISPGRFVHVIQTADSFEDWPHRGFGATTACPDNLTDEIIERIAGARAHAEAQPGFVEGMTIWLAGGWGSARSLRRPMDDETWPLVLIEPADAAVLGACENGKLKDIWRLIKIDRQMRAARFEFISANGLLNMFQWWRDTEFSLIPPHMVDITPPYLINYDTNLLLTAREEARLATDRASRPHPDLGGVLTTRLDRQELSGPPKPIYVSAAHVRRKLLLGCATHGEGIWWVRTAAADGVDSATEFETWKATLEWASIVMPRMEHMLGVHWSTPIEFILRIEQPPEHGPDGPPDDDSVRASLAVSLSGHSIVVHVKSEWQWALHRPDNSAEIELAASLMKGACDRFGVAVEADDLRTEARSAAGSSDYRFRHALEAVRAIDTLRGLQLVGRAPYLSRSAAALVKCGSAWETRDRSLGPLIEGKDDCIGFLTAYNAAALTKLIAAVEPFDRKGLVEASLRAMQGALAEIRNWENTAPALRAIHGEAQDLRNSLEAMGNSNGVLRASAIIAEIAAMESRTSGGHQVGSMDLEELQALALMVFTTGDLLPALYADRIDPVLKISPAGDMLFDHEFHDVTVRDTATARHARDRARATEEYRNRFSRTRTPVDIEVEFNDAIQAEYGIPHSVIREFSYATVLVADQRKNGVYTIRRSDLLASLAELPGCEELDFAPLVDRFILKSRPTWTDFPAGSTQSDRDLSKFDRRFSLIGRPLVALDDGDDPELVVAPAIIERALVHNLNGATTGSLQNLFWTSKEMRSFASKSGGEAGMAFNEEVARELSAMGLVAHPSALPSQWLNTKKTEEVERLGDIDVLAVSKDGSVVWVVEAKDLKLCRTIGETCRRLGEYRGVVDAKGRPDSLLKHLRRVAYLREHAQKLVATLKLPSTPKVCGLIVVNAVQPMNQLRGEYRSDSHVASMESLESISWETGWG